MKCDRCGSELNRGDVFCWKCGSEIKGVYNNKIKIILLSVLVIVFGIVTTIIILRNNSYKKTLDNYFKAIENQDVELLQTSVFAQYWVEFMEKEFGRGSSLESLEDTIKSSVSDYKKYCGGNLKIGYEITNVKEASKSELASLVNNIYDGFGRYVYSNKNDMGITDAVIVELAIYVDGNQDSIMYKSSGVLLIKEFGKWRIKAGSLYNSFYKD